MMRMTFTWGADIGEFFFKGLEIKTILAISILCGIIALLSILYEGIKNRYTFVLSTKVYSANARARSARALIAAVSCAPSESANLLVTEQNASRNTFSKRFCRLANETIIFFFHNSIGYAVMLSVMVYSGWLFLAVIFGMGLGYFLFGHIAMKINIESVQARTTRVVCSPACPEAGSSSNASKTPSPCRSIPAELNQQHEQSKTITITATCHDNKAMYESKNESDCHQKIGAVNPNDENLEGDCCCRL